MKFEKFLKGCGTHGQIVTRSNGDKWLVCGGVGMKVPAGVVNLLGSGEVSEKVKTLVEGLIKADTDDRVVLSRAIIEKDGKAKDIIRVFGDDLNIEIGIYNSAFGLLEKCDENLAEVEIEDDSDFNGSKFLLVLNYDEDLIGFIRGVEEV